MDNDGWSKYLNVGGDFNMDNMGWRCLGNCDFDKLSDGCNSIWLVDGIISMIWKEANEQLLIASQKGSNSGTGHKDINIELNLNIWRYDCLEEINIFLDVHSPRI